MTTVSGNFSIVIGGPFHSLLSKLGFVDDENLPTAAAAWGLAGIAWLPAASMSLVSFLFAGDTNALSFFSDYTEYTRSLLAISLLVHAERSAHLRLNPLVSQFELAGLVDEADREKFRNLLRWADRRSASALVEAGILVVVLVMARATWTLDLELAAFPWRGGDEYSLAGFWAHVVALPLFQFLVLRWVWRFCVWGLLLRRLSKLRLRLTAFHPDKCGGLGFLCVFPMVFGGLIFALSSAVAANLIAESLHGNISTGTVQAIMIAWIAFVLIIFIGPLTAFIRPLYRLRERAIFRLGRIASEHQVAFERKWLESEATGHDLLGSEDVSSSADLGPIASGPYSLRLVPIAPATVIHLALTAGAPLLAVLATQLSFDAFVQILKSILF